LLFAFRFLLCSSLFAFAFAFAFLLFALHSAAIDREALWRDAC